MHKRCIGLAALLLVITSIGLHAQSLKFNGYLNSGLGFVTSGYSDEDDFIKAFGADSEQNGFRFRLDGTFDVGNVAGANFKFQAQNRLDRGGYFSLPYLYIWTRFWIQPLNAIFGVNAGIIDDTTWQTSDWWIHDDAGEGLGVLLKAIPIESLELGAGAYVFSQQSGSNNNILDFGGINIYGHRENTLPDFGNVKLKPGDVKFVFSGAYTYRIIEEITYPLIIEEFPEHREEVFRVGVSFRTKNKAGWDSVHPNPDIETTYLGRDESSKLIGDFSFLRLTRITAVLAFSLDKLEDFNNNGDIVISETFAYTTKDYSCSFGLDAVQFFYKREKPYKPGMLFNLWGSYTFFRIVPRLDFTYLMGGVSRLGGDKEYMWHRRSFVNIPSETRDLSVLSARASVRFNVTGKTFIELGDMICYDYGKTGAFAESGNTNKKSRLSNAVYLDCTLSF
jgi:hypothetical protein